MLVVETNPTNALNFMKIFLFFNFIILNYFASELYHMFPNI